MSVISRLIFPKGFINASFIVQLAGDLELVYKEAFMQTDTTVGTIKENNVLVEASINDSTIYEKLIVDETEQFYIQHTYFANESNEQQKFIELKEIDDYLNTLLKPNQTISRNELERYIDNQSIFINYILRIDEVNALETPFLHHIVFDFVADIQNNEDYNLEEAINYHLTEDLAIPFDNYRIEKQFGNNDIILTINNENDAIKLTNDYLVTLFKKYGLDIVGESPDTVTTSSSQKETLYLVGLIGTFEKEPVLVTEPIAKSNTEYVFDFEGELESLSNSSDYFISDDRIIGRLTALDNPFVYGEDYRIERPLPISLDFKLIFNKEITNLNELTVKLKSLFEDHDTAFALISNQNINGTQVFTHLVSKSAPRETTSVIVEVTQPTEVVSTPEVLVFSFLFDARVETLFNEDKIKGIDTIPQDTAEVFNTYQVNGYAIERKTGLNFKLRVPKTTAIEKNVINYVTSVFEKKGLKIIRLEIEGNTSLYRVTTGDIYNATEVEIKKVDNIVSGLEFDLFKVTSFELRETQDNDTGETNSVSFELPRVTSGIGEFAIFYSKMNPEKVKEHIKDWVVRDFQTKDMERNCAILSWQYADGAEVTFKNVLRSIEGTRYQGKGDYYFYVATLDNDAKPLNNGKVLSLVGESNSFAVSSIVLQSGRDEIEDFTISFFPPKNTSLIKQYAIFYSSKTLEQVKDYVYDYTIDFWNELASEESVLIVPTTWADGKTVSLEGLNKTIEGRDFKRHEIYNFFIASLNHFYLDIAMIKANPIGVILPKTTPKIESEVKPVSENTTPTTVVTETPSVYIEKIAFNYNLEIKNDVLYAIADEIDGILHWTFKAQNNQYSITKGEGNDFEIEFKPIAQPIVARLLNILPSKLDEYELDFVRTGEDKKVTFTLKAKAIIINEPTLISHNVYFDEEYSFMFEFDRDTLNDNKYDVLRSVDDTIYDKVVVPDRDNFSTKDYDWQRHVGNSFEIIAKNRKMFDKLFDKDFFEDILFNMGLDAKVVKQTSAKRTYEVRILPTEEEKDRTEQLNKIDALASSIARIENMLLNFLQKTTETK